MEDCDGAPEVEELWEEEAGVPPAVVVVVVVVVVGGGYTMDVSKEACKRISREEDPTRIEKTPFTGTKVLLVVST